MKWRLALRIATSPSERWLVKAAEWNPELSSKYRTNRAIGRPRNASNLLRKGTDNFIESGRWALLEEKYTMTSEERQENNARMRRNAQNRPARYVNGVTMNEDEVANI